MLRTKTTHEAGSITDYVSGLHLECIYHGRNHDLYSGLPPVMENMEKSLNL